jgi:glycosyltransferase involved in cell wall biosynthesis
MLNVNPAPEQITLRTLQLGDDWIEDREGGLGRYYFELIRSLPSTGTSATGLVVGSERASISTNGQIMAFSLANEPLWRRLRAARRISLERIDSGQVDLVASHFSLYALPILRRLKSIPHVVHFHGPWAAESGLESSLGLSTRIKSHLEGLSYLSARRLIVLSKSFQKELIHRHRVDENLIRVVPGGIDLERFNANGTRLEAREKLGWPLDRPIILSIRRQVRRMGMEDLIDATVEIVKIHPTALLLLGGSGAITGELKTRIEEHGLTGNVRQLGRVADADLPTMYRAADMTVVPSKALEGFGLITLESMAAGTPVFVTPVGGLPETVQPFAPQCVFAGTTSAEIASLLIEALSGAIPLPSESECRRYAEGFSWPKIAALVRSVYDEAAR